jgi:hypothetical protein
VEFWIQALTEAHIPRPVRFPLDWILNFKHHSSIEYEKVNFTPFISRYVTCIGKRLYKMD